MCSTPVILIATSSRWLRLLRIVVQKTGLGGAGRADDVLEVSSGVSWDILLSEAIACTSDENGYINDETAQRRHGGLEAWEYILWRPDVGGQILGEVISRELLGRLGAFERWVDVECAVGVV
ncbi:hypothetical protein HG531_008651 [Fusarium graminearum]|nr:hypothetical protein HG531_008651 [Fusarium graminearum]